MAWPTNDVNEMNEIEAKVGKYIRSSHPYAFKSGKWGHVVAVVPCRGKDMWLIEWPDGVTDVWNPVDPAAEYEWGKKNDTGVITCL